jgi:hypothetical protein
MSILFITFLFQVLYARPKKSTHKSESIALLESYRQKLAEDDRSIMVEDLGAGSVYFKSIHPEGLSDIARTSLSPRKFSNLYSRIIKEYDYKNVIELGTSLA